jgi:hypothetical protein
MDTDPEKPKQLIKLKNFHVLRAGCSLRGEVSGFRWLLENFSWLFSEKKHSTCLSILFSVTFLYPLNSKKKIRLRIQNIPDLQHIVLPNFDVLVENAAELVIFSIPLKGGLAASLEECIPVLLLLELFVVLWQEIHDLKRARRTL